MQFRFFNREPEVLAVNVINEHNGIVYLNPVRYDPEIVEFCFQFGDDEPVVFATGPNNCTINLSPSSDANMIFNNNGNVFKLFARERHT